jgi:rSAM/selenodomain-associated transferase 1
VSGLSSSPDAPSDAAPVLPRREILIVVAKRPVAGAVKTRLAPRLTPERAADLYRALLGDVLDQSARIAPHRVAKCVAITPPDAVAEFERAVPSGFAVVAQEGPGLGERLSALFTRFSAEGFQRIVVRNSDSPFLGDAYVLDAFERLLRGADAVFGPDGGGGYNLVGLKGPHPRLFLGLTMSTKSVLDETLARAAEGNLRAELLTVGRDVDDPSDLAWLAAEFARPGSGAGALAPRTAAALRDALSS